MSTRKIPVSDIIVNSYFDSNLWLDESFILSTADTPISESLLKSLKEWKFTFVSTDSNVHSVSSGSSYEKKNITTLNDNAEEQRHKLIVKNIFRDFCLFTQKVYETANSENYIDLTSVTEQIKNMLGTLKNERNYILCMSDLKVDGKIDSILIHTVRTTILALAMGEVMKFPNFRLIELGISSLLHEVGMMKIPAAIYNKPGKPTEMEKTLIATHPVHGLRMLQEFSRQYTSPLSQDILMGIAQHHERLNGMGYPRRIKGESINQFARIIAVACTYEAMISNRPHKKACDGHTALMRMLKETRISYDEKAIAALVEAISIYPLGTYVQLANGSSGLIVDFGKNARCPKVKLILDEDSHLYKEQPVIETSNTGARLITSCINEADFSEIIRKFRN